MESRERIAACYQFEEEATSHYEALDVNENAEYAEIRGRYRAAVLALHPDKTVARGGDLQHEEFVRIQRAWDVLSDREVRAAYDSFLLRQRTTRDRDLSCKVITDVVVLEDMEEVEGWGYVYPCRCGDCFSVSIEDLKEEAHAVTKGIGEDSSKKEHTPDEQGGSKDGFSVGEVRWPMSLRSTSRLVVTRADLAGQDTYRGATSLLQNACVQSPQGGVEAMQLFIEVLQPDHGCFKGYRWRISSSF